MKHFRSYLDIKLFSQISTLVENISYHIFQIDAVKNPHKVSSKATEISKKIFFVQFCEIFYLFVNLLRSERKIVLESILKEGRITGLNYVMQSISLIKGDTKTWIISSRDLKCTGMIAATAGLWKYVFSDSWDKNKSEILGDTALSLQTAHSSSHDFIDEQQVAGDDGAGVDDLLLDNVVVEDA